MISFYDYNVLSVLYEDEDLKIVRGLSVKW